MKTLILATTVILTLGTVSAMAEHPHHEHEGHEMMAAEACADVEVITVSVNGMVCDFCATALEKVIGKRDDVEVIAVDLDAGKVTITMATGQSLDDETVTQLITDAGYDTQSIDRECNDE